MNQKNHDIPDSCKNKCDCCGLKTSFPPNTGELFADLRELNNKGIISHRFTRALHRSSPANQQTDIDDFCLVHDRSFTNTKQHCRHWILRHPDLSASDYLAISSQNESLRLQSRVETLTIATVIIALIALVVSLVSNNAKTTDNKQQMTNQLPQQSAQQVQAKSQRTINSQRTPGQAQTSQGSPAQPSTSGSAQSSKP